jgi:hypothetical protein
VQNILDCHPDICGGPEFQHLPDIIEVRRKLHASLQKRWIDLFCSAEAIDQQIGALIENLLLPLADRSGCRFLSEKTPANVLIFDDLMILFPHARFIHVIRDPRAVVASLLQVGERIREKFGRSSNSFTLHLLSSIRHARNCMSAGLAAASKNPDKVLTVVYERLVTDPENETKGICNFLKVDWCQQLLHPGGIKHPGETAIVNDLWYSNETYNRDPDTIALDKWKSQLSTMQQVIIASLFRDVKGFEELGYDLSLKGLSRTGILLDSVLSLLQKALLTAQRTKSLRALACPVYRAFHRTDV